MQDVAYKCNLVVPGWPKSGTSSLHEYLNSHPYICMSRPKEPHFFVFDDRYQRGAESHNALFNHAFGGETYFGESSTLYCLTHVARQRIASDLDNPRIIILLRNPVERTISHYKWMFALGQETRKFSKALKRNGFGYDPLKNWCGLYKGYLQFSNYSDYVPLWLETFGEKRVLLLFSEELSESRESVLHKVSSFLELDEFPPLAEVRANRTELTKPAGIRRRALVASRFAPEPVKSFYRRSRLLKDLWRAFSRPQTVRSPEITHDDKYLAETLLSGEVEFYEELRFRYTALDRCLGKG